MISAITLRPYCLSLHHPWRSAHGSLVERRGWLVRCELAGLSGYGDCAPLLSAGTEDEAAARAWLCAWRARALGRPLDEALEDLTQAGEVSPAASYAAECALCDLAAQVSDLPLACWLEPSIDPAFAVPVNAALGNLAGLTPGHLAASAAEGYRVFKIKLGVDALDVELRRLAELAKALPPFGQFRLDANGAWSLDQARLALTTLSDLPIEALEEPLTDPDPVILAALQAQVEFPLALDESLTWSDFYTDLAQVPVRRLVLKPAALGGLRRTLGMAKAAQAAGLQVVVTSLLESAAGLWPTLHLAAAIGSPIPQGLATAGWLTRDLGESPRPERGRIPLSVGPGGGFRPYSNPRSDTASPPP
jgi:o-succinylbenzoate synthase